MPNPQRAAEVPYPVVWNGTLDEVAQAMKRVLVAQLRCSLITMLDAGPERNNTFIHARCLSTWEGYPDDVAIRVDCNGDNDSPGGARAWVHAQSRAGVWDFDYNLWRAFVVRDSVLRSDVSSFDTSAPCLVTTTPAPTPAGRMH